jgi:hypothetical protein
VKVLVRVIAVGRPPENDGEVGIHGGDADELLDTFDRTRLNVTCLIPALARPSMISAGFSVLGLPAATQKPSIGKHYFPSAATKATGMQTSTG